MKAASSLRRHNSVSCTFGVGFGSESLCPTQHAVANFDIRAENHVEKGHVTMFISFAHLLYKCLKSITVLP